MQTDLNPSFWEKDPETGYLRNKKDPNAITPAQKAMFLEALKKLGTVSGAAKFAGFSPRLISTHRRGDAKFNEDFNLALEEMAHTLEAVMYINAQTPRGTLDRFGWLRAHFPKKWNPKIAGEDDKEVKKTIDRLWNEAVSKDNGEK